MSYQGRLSLALTASTLLVALSIALTPHVLRNIDASAIVVPEPHPIQLDLRKLEPLPVPKKDPPKRIVDAGAETQRPVRETDLISSKNTQAQDNSDKTGDPTRAAVDEVDEFDQLGATPTPPASQPAPQQAAPAEPAAQQTPPPADSPAPPEQTPPAQETPSGPAPEKQAPGVPVANRTPDNTPAPDSKPMPQETKVAEAKPSPTKDAPKTEPKPEDKTKPTQEPFKVAAAQPNKQPPAPQASPQIPVQELRAEKGREGGGATNSGFTSFEANKHVLGEYMLKVRNAVEREWRTVLHLRYSGVSRTSATIHCSIRPDGTLESVTITEAGDSLTYAVLCREAIEQAGPFEPFPFDVPEIYKNENLEINWRFSYM